MRRETTIRRSLGRSKDVVCKVLPCNAASFRSPAPSALASGVWFLLPWKLHLLLLLPPTKLLISICSFQLLMQFSVHLKVCPFRQEMTALLCNVYGQELTHVGILFFVNLYLFIGPLYLTSAWCLVLVTLETSLSSYHWLKNTRWFLKSW